jgi:Flp pilus assembly protein TadD
MPGPASLAHDPERAASLRAAGLDQLNRGEVAHAKLLLQQARRLDPANPLIQRDLDRAVRLSSARSGS